MRIVHALCGLAVVCLATISTAPAAAAPARDRLPDDYINGQPIWYPPSLKPDAAPQDRLPDDYTEDGKPVYYPVFDPKPIAEVAPPPIPRWETEVGGRYFVSGGRTQVDLYLFRVGDFLLSRLTYSGLTAHAGELFGRAEHASGFFVKGFAGGGSIGKGNLQDEDFFLLRGDSSTNSDLRNGRLAYLTADFGWTWRSKETKLGFFLGYNYYHELLNAYGCTQTAGNPDICTPTIPNSILGITYDTNIHSARLGFNGEWKLGRGWTFGTDIAWLPFTWRYATDNHWLRPLVAQEKSFTVSNLQAEALLRYQLWNGLSVGGGIRYWKYDNTFAQVVFDGTSTQALSLHTERWGAFLQASYKFGELRPTMDE